MRPEEEEGEAEDRRGCSLRAERPLARAKTSKGQDAGAGS